MHNILIVGSNYLSDTDANGVCTKNIAHELLSHGNKVSIVSESKENNAEKTVVDGVNVYKVRVPLLSLLLDKSKKRGTFFKLFFRVVSILRYCFVVLLYPDVSPFRTQKVKKMMYQIIEEEKIDTVIGMYRPYESVKAVLLAKKRYGSKIKAITYHLDLIQSPSNKNGFIKKYKQQRGKKAIEKELGLVDLMLLPESADDVYKNRSNVKTVDFPLYVKKEFIKPVELPFDTECINISYIGSLDKDNRNPLYIIKALEQVTPETSKKIRLNIWGKLSDKETEDIVKDSEVCVYHGTVENKYVPYILSESDFVLNIGNMITYDMIPSKIFQLFASSRPIINVIRHENDFSLRYFRKYGYCINVKEYEDSSSVISDIQSFIKEHFGKKVCVSDGSFIKSTPEYLVDLINKVLKVNCERFYE